MHLVFARLLDSSNVYRNQGKMEVVGIRQDEYGDFQAPKITFTDICDPRLERAMSVAMETNQITPLLKEELRLSILTKRFSEGKEDIQVNFPQPRSYDLTPAEMEKREKRKLQNKIAARKHRLKSKSKMSDILEELQKQEQLKEELEKDYNRLFSEKQEILCSLLDQHNGVAVSCDHCENEAGCEPIKLLLNVTGTINVESNVFTVIQLDGTSLPDPPSPSIEL
ncbi:cyclic AMP-dependent transcription factor ATF-3-like [Haliotis cracherodii]|uniref:cyclic AMP-dependent transcription factor ATF-3-like n=1 Tax=Haliotis cracherodii TaxID=6455 RepID=UPI0039E83F17